MIAEVINLTQEVPPDDSVTEANCHTGSCEWMTHVEGVPDTENARLEVIASRHPESRDTPHRALFNHFPQDTF